MYDLYIDNTTVTLRMLPVCNCGYIFRDGVIIEEIIGEVRGYKYPTYSIDPPHCPKCNRLIDGIQYTPPHHSA